MKSIKSMFFFGAQLVTEVWGETGFGTSVTPEGVFSTKSTNLLHNLHEVGSFHDIGNLGGYGGLNTFNSLKGAPGLGHNEAHASYNNEGANWGHSPTTGGSFGDTTNGMSGTCNGDPLCEQRALASMQSTGRYAAGPAPGTLIDKATGNIVDEFAADYAIVNSKHPHNVPFAGVDQFSPTGSAVDGVTNSVINNALRAENEVAERKRTEDAQEALHARNVHSSNVRGLQAKAAQGNGSAEKMLQELAGNGDKEAANALSDLGFAQKDGPHATDPAVVAHSGVPNSGIEGLPPIANTTHLTPVPGAVTPNGFGGTIVNGVDRNGNSLTGVDSRGNATQAEGVTANGLPVDGSGNLVHNGTVHNANDENARESAIIHAQSVHPYGETPSSALTTKLALDAINGVNDEIVPAAHADVLNKAITAGIINENTPQSVINSIQSQGVKDLIASGKLSNLENVDLIEKIKSDAVLAAKSDHLINQQTSEEAIREIEDNAVRNVITTGKTGNPSLNTQLTKIEQDAVTKARNLGIITDDTPDNVITEIRENAIKEAIMKGQVSADQIEALSREPLTADVVQNAVHNAAMRDLPVEALAHGIEPEVYRSAIESTMQSAAVQNAVTQAIEESARTGALDKKNISETVASVLANEMGSVVGHTVGDAVGDSVEHHVNNAVAQNSLSNVAQSLDAAAKAANTVKSFVMTAAAMNNDPAVASTLEKVAREAGNLSSSMINNIDVSNQLINQQSNQPVAPVDPIPSRTDPITMVEAERTNARAQAAIQTQENFAAAASRAANEAVAASNTAQMKNEEFLAAQSAANAANKESDVANTRAEVISAHNAANIAHMSASEAVARADSMAEHATNLSRNAQELATRAARLTTAHSDNSSAEVLEQKLQHAEEKQFAQDQLLIQNVEREDLDKQRMAEEQIRYEEAMRREAARKEMLAAQHEMNLHSEREAYEKAYVSALGAGSSIPEARIAGDHAQNSKMIENKENEQRDRFEAARIAEEEEHAQAQRLNEQMHEQSMERVREEKLEEAAQHRQDELVMQGIHPAKAHEMVMNTLRQEMSEELAGRAAEAAEARNARNAIETEMQSPSAAQLLSLETNSGDLSAAINQGLITQSTVAQNAMQRAAAAHNAAAAQSKAARSEEAAHGMILRKKEEQEANATKTEKVLRNENKKFDSKLTPDEIVRNELNATMHETTRDKINKMNDEEILEEVKKAEMEDLMKKGHSEESARVLAEAKHGKSTLGDEKLPESRTSLKELFSTESVIADLSTAAKISPSEAKAVVDSKQAEQDKERAQKAKAGASENELDEIKNSQNQTLKNEMGLVSSLARAGMPVADALKGAEEAYLENSLDSAKLRDGLVDAGVPLSEADTLSHDSMHKNEEDLNRKTDEKLGGNGTPAEALRSAEGEERKEREDTRKQVATMKETGASPAQVKQEMASHNGTERKTEKADLRNAIAANAKTAEQFAREEIGALQKQAELLNNKAEAMKIEAERAALKGASPAEVQKMEAAAARQKEEARRAQENVTAHAARMIGKNLKAGVVDVELGKEVDRSGRAAGHVTTLLALQEPEKEKQMRLHGELPAIHSVVETPPDARLQLEREKKIETISAGPLKNSRHEKSLQDLEFEHKNKIQETLLNDKLSEAEKQQALQDSQAFYEEALVLDRSIRENENLAAKKKEEAAHIDDTSLLLDVIKDGEAKAIDNIESQRAIQILKNEALPPALSERDTEIQEILKNAEMKAGRPLSNEEQIAEIVDYDRKAEQKREINILEEIRENSDKNRSGAQTLAQMAEIQLAGLTREEEENLKAREQEMKKIEEEKIRNHEVVEMPLTDLEKSLLRLQMEKEKSIQNIKESNLHEAEKISRIREQEKIYSERQNFLGKDMSPFEIKKAMMNRAETISKWAHEPKSLTEGENKIVEGVMKSIIGKAELFGEKSLSGSEAQIFRRFNDEQHLGAGEATRRADPELEAIIRKSVENGILPFKTAEMSQPQIVERRDAILSQVAAHDAKNLVALGAEIAKREIEFETAFEERILQMLPQITSQEMAGLKEKAMERELNKERAAAILGADLATRRRAAEELAINAQLLFNEKKELAAKNESLKEKLSDRQQSLIEGAEQLEKKAEDQKKLEKMIKAEEEFAEQTKPVGMEDLKIIERVTDDAKSVGLKKGKLIFPLKVFSDQKPQDSSEMKALKAMQERGAELNNAITSENVPSMFNVVQNDEGYYHIPYNATKLNIGDGTAIFAEDAVNDMKKKNADTSGLEHKVNTGEISEVPFGEGYWVAKVDGMEMQLASPLNRTPPALLTGKDKVLDISKAVGLHMNEARIDLTPTTTYNENKKATLKRPVIKPLISGEGSTEAKAKEEALVKNAVQVKTIETKDGTTAVIDPPVGVEQVVKGNSPLLTGKGNVVTKDVGQQGVGQISNKPKKEEEESLNTLQQGDFKRQGEERIVQLGMEADNGIITNQNSFDKNKNKDKKNLLSAIRSESGGAGGEGSSESAGGSSGGAAGSAQNKSGRGEEEKGNVNFQGGFKTITPTKQPHKPKPTGNKRLKSSEVSLLVEAIKANGAGGNCGGGDKIKEMTCVINENSEKISKALGMSEANLASFFDAIPKSVKSTMLQYKDAHKNNDYMKQYANEYKKLVAVAGEDRARTFTKILGGVLEVVNRRAMPLKVRKDNQRVTRITRNDNVDRVSNGMMRSYDGKTGRRVPPQRRRRRPNKVRTIRKTYLRKMPNYGRPGNQVGGVSGNYTMVNYANNPSQQRNMVPRF